MSFKVSGSGELNLRCFDALKGEGESQAPPGPLDVWVYLLEPTEDGRDLDYVRSWLSPEEQARLGRIQHPRALSEFTAGRRLIREVLSRWIGVHPRELLLEEGEKGALSLAPRYGSTLRFNLSHTPGLVALAVAQSDVGIDVEWTQRGGRTVEIAERYFAPRELEELRQLSLEQQRQRFFQLWTLKEAYIKARGLGLAIPLKSFAFSGFEAEALRIEVLPHASDRPDWAWRFWLGWVGEAHRLAVALG